MNIQLKKTEKLKKTMESWRKELMKTNVDLNKLEKDGRLDRSWCEFFQKTNKAH